MGAVLAGVGATALLAGCGAQSKGAQSGSAPTVSLWMSTTTSNYRQVGAGAKLALAERGGQAGVFRVSYAGRAVSEVEPRATVDALTNARAALQDTQAGALITDVGDAPAKAAITLLNEAGISTVSLADAALQGAACDAKSTFYPNGRLTAIVVTPGGGVPAAWARHFEQVLGFAPDEAAYRGYEGARAVLTALAQPSVATRENPPRLDRRALAAQLVRGHCA